jgi:hypothetical protein
LLRYYATCRFKHPEPVDVRRSMEKASGLQLDWYFNEWINTTRALDYGVKGLLQRNDSTVITLHRQGEMLMPVDVAVVGTDEAQVFYHIPLSLMLGSRTDHPVGKTWHVLPAWNWTDPTYTFAIPGRIDRIHAVAVDPFSRQADNDRDNDQLILTPGTQGVINH